MADLIEILFGVFITSAFFYAKQFYGTRAALELVFVVVAVCTLISFLIAETMQSVCREAEGYEETTEKEDDRSVAFGTVRKLAAYYILLMFTNAFSKVFDRCSEILKSNEEGDNLYE